MWGLTAHPPLSKLAVAEVAQLLSVFPNSFQSSFFVDPEAALMLQKHNYLKESLLLLPELSVPLWEAGSLSWDFFLHFWSGSLLCDCHCPSGPGSKGVWFCSPLREVFPEIRPASLKDPAQIHLKLQKCRLLLKFIFTPCSKKLGMANWFHLVCWLRSIDMHWWTVWRESQAMSKLRVKRSLII